MESRFDLWIRDYSPDAPEVRVVEAAYRKAFGKGPRIGVSDQDRYQEMVLELGMGKARFARLHEADEKEAAEAWARFPAIAEAHMAKFGGAGFIDHPNPRVTSTHNFCDFLERCIRDGVQVTQEVVSREFRLPDSAWRR